MTIIYIAYLPDRKLRIFVEDTTLLILENILHDICTLIRKFKTKNSQPMSISEAVVTQIPKKKL